MPAIDGAHGVPTLHTFVESWECDFNNHWSIRFYGRCFQRAAETVATLAGRGNPGMAVFSSRYIRYHRELRAGDAVEVRSARLADGPRKGAIVHFLLSYGRLATVALDLPGLGAEVLPAVESLAVADVLPRGGDDRIPRWRDDLPLASITQSGPVMRQELDQSGRLVFEDIIRRAGYGVHCTLGTIGYTSDFIDRTGVSRMGVENSVTMLGPCETGAPLAVKSCIAAVQTRSFVMKHWLQTFEGRTVAIVKDHLVAVDMTTRAATEVPEFLRVFRAAAPLAAPLEAIAE